jgi:hypothetical protein
MLFRGSGNGIFGIEGRDGKYSQMFGSLGIDGSF